jgi:hypothetical protein
MLVRGFGRSCVFVPLFFSDQIQTRQSSWYTYRHCSENAVMVLGGQITSFCRKDIVTAATSGIRID